VSSGRRVHLGCHIHGPCAIEGRGVTLYRWPLRSVFIPRERDDRFAVVHPVLEQALGPNDVEGTLTCDNGVWTGPNVDSPEPDGTGGIGGIAA
jgi:hypothetical protein